MKGFAIAVAAAFVVSASPVFAQAQAGRRQPRARRSRAAACHCASRAAGPGPACSRAGSTDATGSVPQPVPFRLAPRSASSTCRPSRSCRLTARLPPEGQRARAEKADRGGRQAKALQTNQQKLETSGSVMSEAARGQLQKDIERQTVEGQRFEQDAQAELNELQQQLQQEFQARLMPVLESISKEKGLQVLFSAGDSGRHLGRAGIDLTLEAVKRLDAAQKK
jgi:Skp family chaperone for outer membrane proteins